MGNGDIGNQGVHEMDLVRWTLGVGFPNKVSAIGGHFLFDDDQETPNTLNAASEFNLPNGKRKMLEFEVRHWMTNTEAGIGLPSFGAGAGALAQFAGEASRRQSRNKIGGIVYGSKGYMALSGGDGAYKT